MTSSFSQINKYKIFLKFNLLRSITKKNFCSQNNQNETPVKLIYELNNLKGVIIGELQSKQNKNALSHAMIKNLDNLFDQVKENQNARILILRSSVSNVFCAGADLKERCAMPNQNVNNFVTGLRTLFTKLAELPIPTIAEIDGAAFGGGLELALACDIRVASKKSFMGLVETHLGIIPGAGGTQRLSRLIGIAKAKELIFTGEKLSSDEAEKIGLINYSVVNPSEKTLELCQKILKAGPLAIRAAKMAINRGFDVDINNGLVFEQQGYMQVIWTKDRVEGMKAFLEKRTPTYIGK